MEDPFRAEETGRMLLPASAPFENRKFMRSSNRWNVGSHSQSLGMALLKRIILPDVSHTTIVSAACSMIDRARRSEARTSSFFFCSVRSVTTCLLYTSDAADE